MKLLLPLAAGLAVGLAAAAEARTCAVDAVEGDGARAWRDGAWSDLSATDPIAPETTVSTGPGARVRIACDDGVVVTIGVDTEANLEQLAGPSGPGRSVVLQLLDGIVGVVAPSRTWREFEVRTPVAIASVRSTEWLVEHGAEAGAAVFVRRGAVAVATLDGRSFALTDGEGISIDAAGEPDVVKTWGAPRIEQSAEALGFDWR